MTERTRRIAIAALVVATVVFVIALLATWRDCAEAGGKTVRGLFWLECIT